MELSDLAEYTKERCKQERPMLYIGIYFGNDINEKRGTLPTLKKRPMFLMAGVLNAAYNLSSNSAPGGFFELYLDSPWIRLDINDEKASWENSGCIDAVREGDIVEFNRTKYERTARTEFKKWRNYPFIKQNQRGAFYHRKIALLAPYFLLINELARQESQRAELVSGTVS